jgi:TPR repeat protein
MMIGHMYKNGEGVAQNYQEAAKWLRLAAAQGQALAQHSLGEMHINGHGVPLVTGSPRLRPLAEMNLIDATTRKTNRSGRSAIIWCAIREAQP